MLHDVSQHNPPEWAILTALWLLPAFYSLCFLAGSILQLRYFILNDVDFSFFLTQPWRLWTFGDWQVPFAVAIEGGAPYYAIHCTPLSLLLAPVIGLLPSEYTLAAIHAGCASLTSFLLPRISLSIYNEKNSRWLWTSLTLLAIFFFFRPYLTAWSRQTHFTTLVTPILALAILCLHKRRLWAAWLCALVVCLGQERASIAVFGLGLYAFFLTGQRKTGIAFCILSAAWFFGATMLWLPWMRRLSHVPDSYIMLGRIGPLADWPEKCLFLLRLCAFTCFLPFCGKKAALAAGCALPNLATGLISRRPGMYDLKGQYEDLPSIFLLVSMIYGLIWLQARLRPIQWKTLFATGALAYAALLIPANTSWHNPLATALRLLDNPQRPELEMLNEDIQPLKNIPGDATFYTQSGLGPRLALHPDRLLIRKDVLEKRIGNAIFAFSPLCGTHEFGCEYDEAIKLADNHPDLTMLCDTGRLRIYASRGFLAKHPGFAHRLQAQTARAKPSSIKKLTASEGKSHAPANH